MNKTNVKTLAQDTYRRARIANVRQGKGVHADTTYAQIVDEHGEMLVNATLEYCERVLAERRGEVKL